MHYESIYTTNNNNIYNKIAFTRMHMEADMCVCVCARSVQWSAIAPANQIISLRSTIRLHRCRCDGDPKCGQVPQQNAVWRNRRRWNRKKLNERMKTNEIFVFNEMSVLCLEASDCSLKWRRLVCARSSMSTICTQMHYKHTYIIIINMIIHTACSYMHKR